MRPGKYALALTELLLIFPAALFMTALFVRNLQPLQYEPAHTAQGIVTWYSHRLHLGLWIFLMALPLVVLATGAVTLWRRWVTDADLREAAHETLQLVAGHLETLVLAATTLAAAGVLAIVALHVVTD